MDEKPKSIWKKSWVGWRGFLLSAVLVFAVVMFIGWLAGADAGLILSIAGILLVVSLVLVVGVGLFRWLFCWRNFKRGLFGLACFITLIALFYAEEDWRGKHDWEKFKREWAAKGERFDWQSIVPPPVPDDQNFAFSPVWIGEVKFNFQSNPKRVEAWYGNRIYSEEVSNLFSLMPVSESGLTGTNWYSQSDHHLPNMPEGSGGWATAHATDLKPWQSYYREVEKTYPAAGIPVAPQPQSSAADVLLALSKFDPVIEQLRQDSARPYSRFPIGYDDEDKAMILLPHLAAVKQFSLVLRLRAIAELQNGETEKAFDDVKLSLRLIDSIRSEPFLISHLVRIAMLQITLQPIWEGLAEHQWSDAQLADLDSELAKLDFLADYQFAIRGERGLYIANIDFFRHPHDQIFKHPRLYSIAPLLYLIQEMSDEGESSQMSFQMLALSFGPSGWIDQNELRIARFETKWYLPIVDDDAKTISQAKIRAADNALGQEIRHRTPENVLETLFLPALGGAEKFAYAQCSADLARVGIALERYRLAHGDYPESLDALSPQFMEKIPHDVIDGQPLHYRLTNDGQFVLYSVGWNETDDGGVVVTKPVGMNSNRTPIWDISQGDWVWRYPEK
ncbi:MAG TPA: hypothetical protein VIK35_00370 [Verrucomicrobiae bacterium]